MEISNDFINAIENRNYLRVKLILKNSIIIDPTGETFNKLLDFTIKRIPDLFDNHDGELFKDEPNWTEDYFNEETVKIIDNFSKERVMLLIAMADKLFNKKVIQPSLIHYNNSQQSYCKFISSRTVVGTSLAVIGIAFLVYIVIMKQVSIVTILSSVAFIGFGGALLFQKK